MPGSESDPVCFQVRIRLVLPYRLGHIHSHDRHSQMKIPEQATQPSLCQHYDSAAVLYHEKKPFGRIRAVQWYIRSSSFQDGKHGRENIEATLEANGHGGIWSHTE